MNTWRLTLGAVALCVGATTGPLSAQGRIASLEERFAGAERVVVAEARGVTSAWHQNEHGDRIIVTRVRLDVGETMKGARAEQLWFEVEGGTIDGITLEVSSVPLMREGDRGVFFLNAAERNMHRPFLKGQGILKLDENELVRGSALHISQIRSLAGRQ